MKYLAEMTFVEVQEMGKDALAILPIGAIEAHGPHLPLMTDVIIARAMAASGARALEARGFSPIVIAPLLQWTSAGFAQGFPGITVQVFEGTPDDLNNRPNPAIAKGL